MIKNLLIVCLLLAIAVHIQAQSPGSSCRTPDRENGICVRLRGCPEMRERSMSFVRRSRCGNRGDFVCCTDPVTTPALAPIQKGRTRPTTTTRRPRVKVSPRRLGSRSNRISAKKCDEYADFAYNKSYVMQIHGPDLLRKRSNCAATAVGLVYGGKEAKRREFPHMALVGFFYGNEIHWDCGGTLISERFVLSAEHCSSSEDTGPAKYVRLGEHNIAQTFEANHIDFDIIETISHTNAPSRTFNDIALFKLDRDVEFNHAIRPACLPQEMDVQEAVIATGWGSVEGGQKSNALLKVDLTTFSQHEWSRTQIGQIFNKDFDEQSMVFAGHHTERRDTCDGDSGGPLQILDPNHNCTYIVVGVTSRGIRCGLTRSPGLYTKVYSHLDWIEQTVWPNQ